MMPSVDAPSRPQAAASPWRWAAALAALALLLAGLMRGLDRPMEWAALFMLLALSGLLVRRLKHEAISARAHAAQAEQLRSLGELLRDTESAQDQAPQLSRMLEGLVGLPVLMLILKQDMPSRNDMQAAVLLGEVHPEHHAELLAGLWACMRRSEPFGPGAERHQELPCWYLPMRGRDGARGAAMIPVPDRDRSDPVLREQAQALCDQMGQALARQASERKARQARQAAQGQATRNALLAAISHDYRTPLATIMSAASALQSQTGRLSEAQAQKLLTSILDETRQLSRMTDNTLQLARLESPEMHLHMDWESAEEIVGSVLQRVRTRLGDASRRVRARLEPHLPLLRCDAVLLTQLLDNLVDNALKYGGDSAVEVRVRLLTEPGVGYYRLAEAA